MFVSATWDFIFAAEKRPGNRYRFKNEDAGAQPRSSLLSTGPGNHPITGASGG
ncbi:hypothetical protein ASZ90_015581 [hydrocarbon metagenome]|uniref:Uncharacterized protein n=1 Tax=hydrocarbon metagenome TaxID=938273 RepID=A0A0W8F2H3_9ZZZZ